MSWASAKKRGVPWFSAGKPPRPSVQRESVPRLSSGRPAYQSRARRKKAAKVQQVEPARISRRETAAFYRLKELTHNRDVAERLIDQVQVCNPRRDRRWCTEKAIWDIERDRMA